MIDTEYDAVAEAKEAEEGGEEFFGFSSGTQVLLTSIYRITVSFVNVVVIYWFIPALVGFLTNVLNFIVLSRKSMRISSINILLMALAVSDLLFLIYPVYRKIVKLIDSFNPCELPETLFVAYTSEFLITVRASSDRCSTWLGLSIAIIRTLVMRNPLKSANLNKPKTGVRLNIVILLISSCFAVFEFLWLTLSSKEWDPNDDPDCSGLQLPNLTSYFWVVSPWMSTTSITIHSFLSSIFSYLMPCFLFPFCSVFLIYDVAKARKNNQILSGGARKNQENTSKLVSLLTFTFVVTTFPNGIMDLFQWQYPDHYAVSNLASYIAEVVFSAKTVTTTIHVIICWSLSSVYRETARNLMGWKKINNNSNVLISFSINNF